MTVYRQLMRAEPSSLERLCLAISSDGEGGGVREEYCWYPGVSTKKKDESSKVLVYNSYFYPTLERMKKLRHVVLHGVCDNQARQILFNYGDRYKSTDRWRWCSENSWESEAYD